MRRVIIAVAALCVASPLAAQDGSEPTGQRTVEGAQKFLADYYKSIAGGVHLSANVYEVEDHWEFRLAEPAVLKKWESIEADLVAIEPRGRCKSSVTLSGPTIYQPYRFRRREPLPNSLANMTTDIDWGTVGPVTINVRNRFLHEPFQDSTPVGWNVLFTGGPRLEFQHQDEASARRAALAMEFLREQCGFKTETGF